MRTHTRAHVRAHTHMRTRMHTHQHLRGFKPLSEQVWKQCWLHLMVNMADIYS